MKPDVQFRPATATDLPAILFLIAADQIGPSREDLNPPLAQGYVDAFSAIEKDPNQILAVAELEGQVIGTLQLSFIPGLARRGAWRGQIEALRISQNQRGQGIGMRFVHWAVECCRARNCQLVQLTSNSQRAEAHKFYSALGFEASHTGFKLKL